MHEDAVGIPADAASDPDAVPDLEPSLDLIRRGLHIGLPEAAAEPSEPAEETLTDDELERLRSEMESALSGIRVDDFTAR